jgi:PAS domain S-box-containing protein
MNLKEPIRSSPVQDITLFKAIAESLQKGIIVVDNDEIILYANSCFCKLLGYGYEELIGRDASEMFLDRKEALLNKSRIASRQKGFSEEYEVECRAKSGDIVLLNIYGTPFYNEAGEIVGSIGYHRDISRVKYYQGELEEALRQRNELIHNIREAFFSINTLTGKNILISDAHEEIYGYPVKAFHDNPQLWFEVIHADDKAMVVEGMKKLSKGETTYDEHRIIRKNGEVIWVEGRVVPTLNEKGELIRVDGLVSDISKRKKAENLLKGKISDLNTFIYKASHDLGGPLASMLGLINLSESKNESAEIAQYLSLFRLSLDKMTCLLKDLVSTVSITMMN